MAYLTHHPLFDARLTGLTGEHPEELGTHADTDTDVLAQGSAKRKRGREAMEVGSREGGADGGRVMEASGVRVLVASAFTFDPSGQASELRTCRRALQGIGLQGLRAQAREHGA